MITAVAAAAACTDTRPEAPLAPDAGSSLRIASVVTKDDAVRVVQRFLAGLDARDRVAIGDTVLAVRLADAVDKSQAQPLGPERHGAFRDALATEIIRDDWRSLYQGASVNRVTVGSPKAQTVVVITLDGGAERRAEVANENGQPRIVRVY